jgi:transcriptional regulator of heat shock response
MYMDYKKVIPMVEYTARMIERQIKGVLL